MATDIRGVVARDPKVRAEAIAALDVRGYAEIGEALDDPGVRLVVIATPHDSHADLTLRALEAGKDCVVDKVMALSAAEADRMIAARDATGRMLSVFHNRRWDVGDIPSIRCRRVGRHRNGQHIERGRTIRACHMPGTLTLWT